VDQANEELAKEKIVIKENVQFIVSDFLQFDVKKKRYDTITITEVLEHLYEPKPKEFIDKSYNLLVDNGTLIVTVPLGINDFPDHKKTYYYQDIHSMLYPFFDIVDVSFIGKWIGFVARKRSHPMTQPISKILLPTTLSRIQCIRCCVSRISFSPNSP